MNTLFALLLAFQVKHFIADYPLQVRYMLGKFRQDWGFLPPLLAHAGVHALGTFLIACSFGTWQAVCLALFDATVHATMDRLKASKRYLGRFKTLTSDTAPTATEAQWKSNNYFWWSMGLDQGVHHLTHYVECEKALIEATS